MSRKHRIVRLETMLQSRQPTWSAEIAATRVRVAARARLHVGEALDVCWHPSVQSARAQLHGDSPALAAADLERLQAWGRTHPEALTPDDGSLARISEKLDELARRQQAWREHHASL